MDPTGQIRGSGPLDPPLPRLATPLWWWRWWWWRVAQNSRETFDLQDLQKQVHHRPACSGDEDTPANRGMHHAYNNSSELSCVMWVNLWTLQQHKQESFGSVESIYLTFRKIIAQKITVVEFVGGDYRNNKAIVDSRLRPPVSEVCIGHNSDSSLTTGKWLQFKLWKDSDRMKYR